MAIYTVFQCDLCECKVNDRRKLIQVPQVDGNQNEGSTLDDVCEIDVCINCLAKLSEKVGEIKCN